MQFKSGGQKKQSILEICPLTETARLRFFVCETFSVAFRTSEQLTLKTQQTADFILFPLLRICEFFCDKSF